MICLPNNNVVPLAYVETELKTNNLIPLYL